VRPFVLIFVSLAAATSFAQLVPELRGGKISTPPVIDGIVNDDEWQGAAKSQGLVDMNSGEKAPDDGEFWIAYDAQYIYVAARLADPAPASIRAVEYRTNAGLGSDDNFMLRLDPSGQLEIYNQFYMNAAGGSSLQIAGGRAIKREWLGEFLTKGRVTEKGWETEARIPWRLIQLPAAGVRDMKINFIRYSSRTQRQSTWAYNGGMRAYHGWWRGVEVPKVPFERTLKLLPYGFAGHDEEDGGILTGGLDFKTSINERIEAVGTISPDFRNVENDILSLDFSYFERLPSDPRPFFQEGDEYYSSYLFASQRIRRFDTGLNLYGKLTEKLNFGLLNTVDFDNEYNTVGALNYQHNKDEFWRLGFTRNQGDFRPDNTAYFVRYSRQFGQRYSTQIRYSGTDDEVDGKGFFADANVSYFDGTWNFYTNLAARTPDYQARLGFFPDRDWKGISGGGSYRKTFEKGPLMEFEAEFGGGSYERYDSNDFYTDDLFGVLSFTGRDGFDFDIGHSRSKFLGFKDHRTFLSIEKPRGDAYRRWQLDLTDGFIAGEDYRSVGLTFLYRPIKRLQTGLTYQYQDHFDKSTLAIFSANMDLGNDHFLNGRLVKRDDDWSGYVSFRRSGNRGTEYYLILGNPNSLKWESTVILKAVIPFELKF
jgi:hypothetical protein